MAAMVMTAGTDLYNDCRGFAGAGAVSVAAKPRSPRAATAGINNFFMTIPSLTLCIPG